MESAPLTRRPRAVLSVAVLAALLLSGCSPTPAPTLPATPAALEPNAPPTGEPALPTAAAIVVDGDAFSIILSDGAVGERVPFTSTVADATASLRSALGAETATVTVPDRTCEPAHTRTEWSDALQLISNYSWLPTGQQFALVMTSDSLGDVSLEAAGGHRVGASSSAVVSGAPSAQVESFSYEGVDYEYVQLDIEGGSATGDDLDLWGSLVTARDGVIDRISSPVAYLYGANC